ncbi:unnamed protein product [Alopecurus aequalis]
MEDTALASELDRLQAMARELGARVHDEGAPDAARDICAALAASVDRAVRLAGANGNADPGKNNGAQIRTSRKGDAKVRRQVRVASVEDTGPLDDGLSWRKYGQKDILGAKYPRAYFRCTHRHTRGCQATKHVQRADADPLLFHVVYNGEHTCATHGAAPSLLTSLEQQLPPAAGSPVGADANQRWPAEPLTPPGAIDDCCPPASTWCQLAGNYGYAADGGPGAEMEFEAQLDEFLNPSQFFQPGIQSL